MSTLLWVDASAGVAGDMLLAALLDAGADLEVVRRAVEAVVPGEVVLGVEQVTRAGLAATHLTVAPAVEHEHHRPWRELSALLGEADLADPVRDLAIRAFAALARAEGAVHGVPEEEVHFHEVGAWDSVADIVGVSAAVHDLGVTRVSATAVGLGSGTVRAEHGVLPVPVPAVLRLLADGPVVAGDGAGLVGECATPTGVALLVALLGGGGPGQAPSAEPVAAPAPTPARAPAPAVSSAPDSGAAPAPVGRVRAVGLGAGSRDNPDRANVVRVVLHEAAGTGGRATGSDVDDLVEIAATVDDLDPRVWPSVLDAALAAGALDAWLVPVLMKKGRPGMVVHLLARPKDREDLVALVLRHTPTLGVRWHQVARLAVAREWREVRVPGGAVRVKLGLEDGRVLTATPELEDCRALAEAMGRPLRQVLRDAEAAAQSAGWCAGAAI